MDRRVALSIVFAGVSSLYSDDALSQGRAIASKTLLIGHCAAFSGPFSDLGNQFHLGARLVFDSINQAGGVHGSTIDLRKLDDAFDPDRTMTNVMALAREQVFALFGLMGARNVSAVLRFSEAEGIPLFAPMTGSPDLRREHTKYLIHVRASYEDELDRIFAHFKLIGVKKLSLVLEDGAYGETGFEGVRQVLRKHIEGDFTSRMLLRRGETDVSEDKVGSLLASRPDVVVFLTGYKAAARMIRLARQRRFTGNFFTVLRN
jgi:branched-chain amino acid transport system substrate-binding protein